MGEGIERTKLLGYHIEVEINVHIDNGYMWIDVYDVKVPQYMYPVFHLQVQQVCVPKLVYIYNDYCYKYV